MKSKQLRGLAIIGRERSKLVFDVPTMNEAGVKEFESTRGMALPACRS